METSQINFQPVRLKTDSERKVHTKPNQGPKGSPAPSPEAVASTPDLSPASIAFQTDRNTGKLIIQIIDRNTGEIIRQIPPEEIRRFAESLRNLKGSVLNKRV